MSQSVADEATPAKTHETVQRKSGRLADRRHTGPDEPELTSPVLADKRDQFRSSRLCRTYQTRSFSHTKTGDHEYLELPRDLPGHQKRGGMYRTARVTSWLEDSRFFKSLTDVASENAGYLITSGNETLRSSGLVEALHQIQSRTNRWTSMQFVLPCVMWRDANILGWRWCGKEPTNKPTMENSQAIAANCQWKPARCRPLQVGSTHMHTYWKQITMWRADSSRDRIEEGRWCVMEPVRRWWGRGRAVAWHREPGWNRPCEPV